VAKFACDGEPGWREIDLTSLALELDLNAARGRDPLKALQKIDVEVSPSKFAIGDAFQADVLLFLDCFPNAAIFNLAQFIIG
jgi:hypothetical protein